MKKLKNVKTQDLKQETAPQPKFKKPKGIQTRDLGKKKTDRDFVIENFDALTDSDVKKLKLKIEKVIADRKPIWRKCSNCGFVHKSAWDSKKSMCIKCNWRRYKNGGWMIRMSDAEVEKHLEAEKKRMKEWAERSFKIEFENTNRYLRSIGEKPYTEEEFRKRKGYKN